MQPFFAFRALFDLLRSRAILLAVLFLASVPMLHGCGLIDNAHASVSDPSVFAQATSVTSTPAAAPGLFDGLFAHFVPGLIAFALNPLTWGVILGLVWLLFIKKRAWAATVASAAHTAFHVVEDLKATGLLPAGAAKVDVALEKFIAILDAQGLTASDEAIELAKLAWSSLNFQQGQAQANVAAIANAAKSAAPTP